MINAMQLLQDWRGQDTQNALRQAQMDQMRVEGQRAAQMHPLQMEAAQMNMLAKRQAMQEDMARRNALQQFAATGNPNALAMADPKAFAQMQTARERNMLMANRPKPQQRRQIIQTENGPMEIGPDGRAMPIFGPSGEPVRSPERAEKPMTEFQGKASLYGTRMQSAHDTLAPIEADTSQTGLAIKRSLQDTPGIGGILGAGANLLLSKNQQSIEQAQRDFINATLRQESGAVISQPEFENAQRQYFPQPGDSPALLDQKRRNREMAIAGFERMAGREGGQAIRDVRNMKKGAPKTGGASGGWQIQEVK